MSGTWAGMVDEIGSALGGGYSSAADVVKIKRAIVTAIERHRHDALWVNELEDGFTTVASQSAYGEDDGVPRGLVGLRGRFGWIDPSQDADSRREILIVSSTEFDRYRLGAQLEAEPEVMCLFNGRLELWPTPDGVHDIGFRCIVDLGTLIKRFSSSVWKFYKPGTTSFEVANEVGDNYPEAGTDTNRWFDEGYEMIRWYATYLVLGGEIQAQRGQAEGALQRYLEMREALVARSAAQQGAPPFPEEYELDC